MKTAHGQRKVKIWIFSYPKQSRTDVPFADYQFQSAKIVILIGLYINSNIATTAIDLTVNLTALEKE
ncbi:hypothetical protein DRF65_20765 [Chryseobacterium pennae]|uniref:Uncharacterized protein n=1 Tax=Chryseobacterium pennae TaxID=2258962 RepID=A0A3D9C464_9FLAO|nr:hypothetical protein DRF65_20765 [Chryseobacterium pennae]